jgi:hypothetical protein
VTHVKKDGLLKRIWKYFLTWSPREIILLAVASATSLLAAGFAIAWCFMLVPFETVWGPVASWVNVGVTALGFLVAGLTFYLRFREVVQGDDEKKRQQETEDVESTFQLQQLTTLARESMLAEASLVIWEMHCNQFRLSEDVPGMSLRYEVNFLVRNGTGKRLTDVQVMIPQVVTHYGEWPAMTIDVPEFKGRSSSTPNVPQIFACDTRWTGGSATEITGNGEGPMGARDVFGNKVVLTYRVDGGPRWELLLDRYGRPLQPTLKL